MTDYLVYWYLALSDRFDRRTLTSAPRTLRIALSPRWPAGVFLVATWGGLAWLAVSGRVELAVAATAASSQQRSQHVEEDLDVLADLVANWPEVPEQRKAELGRLLADS